jgi:uncharacterized membrane protein YtjA (UPF0391 family)
VVRAEVVDENAFWARGPASEPPVTEEDGMGGAKELSPEGPGHRKRRIAMLGWALTFLVIALIAAALGFGGIAGAAAGLAKIIFVIFLVLLLISLVMHVSRGAVP